MLWADLSNDAKSVIEWVELRFITEDKELQCKQFADSLIFKIRDDSKLSLH